MPAMAGHDAAAPSSLRASRWLSLLCSWRVGLVALLIPATVRRCDGRGDGSGAGRRRRLALTSRYRSVPNSDGWSRNPSPVGEISGELCKVSRSCYHFRKIL